MSKVYQEVTAQIVAALEKGTLPWRQSWADGFYQPIRHTAVPYRGINTIVLLMAQLAKGYGNSMWMTYRQAAALGGQVRKGETSTHVVYFDHIEKERGDELVKVGFAKTYCVFNVEQIDGLPDTVKAAGAKLEKPEPLELELLHLFENIGAVVTHGGGRAFYAPGEDRIHLPHPELFRSPQAYYSVRAHETVHWTMAERRLNRDFGKKKWGDEGYAMEELVAEIGATFFCAQISLDPPDIDDAASYIAGWLKVLKSDPSAIATAAGHAQRACDYLLERARAELLLEAA